jgi:hypothetical protein
MPWLLVEASPQTLDAILGKFPPHRLAAYRQQWAPGHPSSDPVVTAHCCVVTHKCAASRDFGTRECDGYRLWADDQVTVGNFGCIPIPRGRALRCSPGRTRAGQAVLGGPGAAASAAGPA